MSRHTVETDNHGNPIGLMSGVGPSEPSEWRIAGEVFHLSDEHGRVMSPTQSLYALLDGGEVTEQVFDQIATRFDDPEALHVAARQLDVRRVRRDDGTVVVRLPKDNEVPKRSLSEQLGLTAEGHPIVATSRDAPIEPRIGPIAPTSQEHSDSRGDSLNFADSDTGLFNDHASNSGSAIWMSFRAAGKLLGEHGISIIGRLKIYRDHNNPTSRERLVKVADVKALLMQGRSGHGAAEVVDDYLKKVQQQRAGARGNRRLATGAADVARQAIIGGPRSTPAQDRDRDIAQRRRAENSRRRREATATRRTTR